MLTINKLLPQGQGLAPVLIKRAETIELSLDEHQRNRFDTTDSAGRALAVSLPEGTVLHDGDVLVAEDGTMVRVIAAHAPAPTRGKPIGIAIKAAAAPHVHGPGCKHDH